MKKRFCALLLAFCMACALLAMPASAAGGSNTAVQAAVMLGGLDSGQRVMALGCIEGGAAIENVEANVEMPASYVEGYTLYQVGENGETKVDVSVRQGVAYFTVNMQDGAALLEMVKE